MTASSPLGFTAVVYRAHGYNCTNGPSRDHDRITIVGVISDGQREPQPLPRSCRMSLPTEDAPAYVLRRPHNPDYDPTPHLIPVEPSANNMVGPMFGGNYAEIPRQWSNLGDLFGLDRLRMVAIHDRTETQAGYLGLGQ